MLSIFNNLHALPLHTQYDRVSVFNKEEISRFIIVFDYRNDRLVRHSISRISTLFCEVANVRFLLSQNTTLIIVL